MASRRCAAARRCRAELADALRERAGAVWNMYGPTETTVLVDRRARSTRERHPDRQADRATPTCTSSTTDGELGPLGVPGELSIGGAGVARGYHARPELTASSSSPNPFRRPARACTAPATSRAGAPTATSSTSAASTTRSRCAAIRIELGEIEDALARHPHDRRGGRRRASRARAASSSSSPTSSRRRSRCRAPQVLRDHLRAALPDYMVPAVS